MKQEYQIKLIRDDGKFSHNAYVTCEKIEKTGISEIRADGILIDFILEIGEIKVL